ncbi:putative acyl-CoA N-acyltransferase [Cavenderia fasciculata]|uniref:Acyl-CoA N-acyltransferase n=1 Tax=Cavenderia fasciculata TaxID=261658 RepID=F4QFJ8_CACFS|nr:putative acyl-CoA N-acyltransferase [Cavenderia fasciculata]EGG14299.1 putative acyl-CoA N-acyltransferase [Cavenderia fasciculata]|eukprot:XP_004351008.1 putative acyl-CoA N-acyltransferase [Cavenderia fasciculata]
MSLLSSSSSISSNEEEVIELYQIKDSSILLPHVDRFKQSVRIKGIITNKEGLNYIAFVDIEASPTIMLFIDIVRGQLSIFTNDIVRFKRYVNSVDWKKGFLSNPKYQIDMDPTTYPYQKDGLVDHLLPSSRYLAFASLGLEENDILEDVLRRQGLKIEPSPEIFDLLMLPIESKQDKIEDLKQYLEGGESPITFDEADVVGMKQNEEDVGTRKKQMINNNWTYRSTKSLAFMRWTTKHSITSCVRGGKENEIISWAIQYTDGSVGSLFTLPKHRGNSYAMRVVADILIKCLSKPYLLVPFIYINTENQPSQNLFRNLGFRPITLTRWLTASNSPN